MCHLSVYVCVSLVCVCVRVTVCVMCVSLVSIYFFKVFFLNFFVNRWRCLFFLLCIIILSFSETWKKKLFLHKKFRISFFFLFKTLFLSRFFFFVTFWTREHTHTHTHPLLFFLLCGGVHNTTTPFFWAGFSTRPSSH